MLKLQNLIIVLALAVTVSSKSVRSDYDEEAARAYLEKVNVENGLRATESVLASWAYESNITDETLQNQLEVSARLANYTKEVWQETIKYPWQTYQDPDIRRQFSKLSVLGTAALSPEKYEQLDKIINDMQGVYGKAKVCDFYNRTNCELQLEPEITERLVKSRDPDELKYLWIEWRKVSGQPVRNLYVDYVNLSNEAAVLNNFTDNAAFWLKDYEADDFKDQVEALWEQLRPLYLQLHAYVRRRLREQYGEEIVSKTGPIPAHLLGNMWAQTWGNIVDFTVPYPNKPSVDVTPNMVEQGYTPLKMFKLAEEFFTSLNLSAMPETFWNNSIIEKPNDGRDLICHASAWDFYDGKDFRIKMCAVVNMEDLQTVHHEMGHIQYYLQYKERPNVYRDGANPGFHEAVGDVMALSVSTPKHLRKIGLLNTTDDDEESDINQLYNMALDKIAFLPFGYLMDQWRWGVFQGETSSDDYNCKWWELREKYQGLEPPVDRSENDFDPGAKYHIVASVPYIRYFVSFVVQFQFHRSLCIAAGEFDPQNPDAKPLHKCDIYQSTEAGALLAKMLQMGSSKPWPDAMEVLTGQRNMDAGALLQYFATLQEWLEKENARTGEYIGWEPTKRQCTKTGGKNSAKTPKIDGAVSDFNFGLVSQDEYNNLPDNFEEPQPLFHTIFRRSLPSDVYFKRKLTRPNDIAGPSRNSLLTFSDNKKSHAKNKKKLLKRKFSQEDDIYNDCLTDILAEEIRLAREILQNPGDEELLRRYESLQNGGAEVLKNKCILKRWHRDKDKKAKAKEQAKPEKAKEPVKLKEKQKVKEEEKAKLKSEIKPESPFENVNKVPEPQPEPQQPEPQPQPQQPEPQPQFQQPKPQPQFQQPVPQPHFQQIVPQPQFQQPEPQLQVLPPEPQPQFQKSEQEFEPKPEKAFVPKYFVNTFSQQRPDVDLLWNAEIVKNQAKQTIKNLKYLPQTYDPNLRAPKGLTILKMENPKCCNSKHNNKRSHATVTMESGSEKHIADAKQRLESLQNLLKSAGLISEIAQAHNNNYNNNVVPRYTNGYLNEGDVVIINEPNPLLKDKRVKKKSYREFHYNVRTPVCYNSIIIQGCKDNKKQADEKTAKPGEENNKGGANRKRNVRKFSGVDRKFYKSVRWKRKAV